MIETVVLVSGWRGRIDPVFVEFRLTNYHKNAPRPLLIHGACKTGVDKIAHLYARRQRWAISMFQMVPKTPGSAGERHANMIDLATLYVELGSEVFIEAFPHESDSVGTWDLVNKAKKARLPLFINGKAHEYKQEAMFT